MGITVEFRDFNEMVEFAQALLKGHQAEPMKENTVIKKEEVKPPVKEDQVIENPVADDQPAQEEEITFTLEEVRAKLTALTRAGKQKEVKAILDFYEAKNVTALDHKDYAGVMEKAGAI